MSKNYFSIFRIRIISGLFAGIGDEINCGETSVNDNYRSWIRIRIMIVIWVRRQFEQSSIIGELSLSLSLKIKNHIQSLLNLKMYTVRYSHVTLFKFLDCT